MRPFRSSPKVFFQYKATSSELISIQGFSDPSALLKHELAYCLGQMQNPSAVPALESVLQNTSEDPMVRHEVYHEFHPTYLVLNPDIVR